MRDMSVGDTYVSEQREFKSAIADCLKTTSEVLDCSKKLLIDVRNERDRNGLSLYEVKNHDFLAYMSELAFLMCQISYGESIQGSHAVERSVYLRTVMERMRPIEQKMKAQVEKLTAMALGSTKKAIQHLHPRPEMMKIGSNESEGSESSEEEEATNKLATKKYVPPKLVAVPYDEDEAAKQEKKIEQNRRRAMQSSLIRELRNEYSEAPEEVLEERASRKFHQADIEKQRYEEDYFVRLQVTKKERHMRKLESRQNIIDDLLHFGDYMAMDKPVRSSQQRTLLKKRKGSKKRIGQKTKNNKAYNGKKRTRR